MKCLPVYCLGALLCVSGCAHNNEQTLADLRAVDVVVVDTSIENGLDKAMQSYQQYLEATPESAMTPEALRRLADLNIQKEYGALEGQNQGQNPGQDLAAPETSGLSSKSGDQSGTPAVGHQSSTPSDAIAPVSENTDALEARATGQTIRPDNSGALTILPDGSSADDLQTAGAKKAIALYLKLLKEFPGYERNDQVLYQLSRAYEETGQVEDAMRVMNQLVSQYPNSRHVAEVQFRRAEYYFTRKQYLDAEDAYQHILDFGKATEFYELALYKRGWTFYKQDLYEEALQHFTGLLDHKVSIAYDFEQVADVAEKKRIDDTFHVVSLSFSGMGGAEAITAYFKKIGSRPYEGDVYSYLGEFYLSKRRYNDAAQTYKAFVQQNPYHKVAPHFTMRVIDIYHEGGFPMLVVESKKDYAAAYGITAEYWKHFDITRHSDILDNLKKNIIDLASYYHALYQDARFRDKRTDNFADAIRWYKEFLQSFPTDELAAGINYQLADLFLENKDHLSAATEYEKTAYDYPLNDKSSAAAYASVYAYREHLKNATERQKDQVQPEVIRASLRFVDVFPAHEKAAIVLAATADDLYTMKDYPLAIKTAQQFIEQYPETDNELTRSAWLVVAYASFDILQYADAESAYIKVLKYTDVNHAQRSEILDNLAASVYKQGEEAVKLEDHATAADHFLRIGQLAPNSKIREAAEYDAATAFIQLKNWPKAAEVLLSFRRLYPQHPLQGDVTTKLAFAYSEDNKFANAAAEFERIVGQSSDSAIRRESLQTAAELYEKIPDTKNALRIYGLYVQNFPRPVEALMEVYNKIAEIHKLDNARADYLNTLQLIIDADATAGSERNDRTRYLAGMASLAVIEPIYAELLRIQLVEPFQQNLAKKKTKMKENINHYNRLVDYKVGDVTAAATYYIAETYFHFSEALLESERPTNLSALELEEYDLVLEEEAYPFEEKAIDIHKSNIELLSVGVYSLWVEKSLARLGELVPGRYAKYEESTGVMSSILSYRYSPPKPPPAVEQPPPVADGQEARNTQPK